MTTDYFAQVRLLCVNEEENVQKRLLFSLAPFVLCFNFSKKFFFFLQRRRAKRKMSTEMRGKMAQRVSELNVFLQKSKKILAHL